MRSPKNTKSKGLGDSIEKITQATGIKALVKAIAPDCGCEERRKKLNQMFPYYREMSPQDMELFKPFLDWETRLEMKAADVRMIFGIYQRTTGRIQEETRCPACIKNALKTLHEIYNNSCPSEPDPAQ